MGRGNSGLNPKPPNRSAADRSVTSVSLDDGTTIDLSAFPLKYGEKDSYISGDRRKAIDEFENKRYKAKIEFSRVIDKDGNVLAEKRGSKGRVMIPYSTAEAEGVVTHNHPRSGTDAGLLGGTFSPADLRIVVNRKINTIRATAAEGTYSFTKQAGFDAQGFMQHVHSVENQLRSVYSAEMQALGNKLNAEYRNAKTAKEMRDLHDRYVKDTHDAFNKYLVNSHNALLDGQTQYNYTYTLERRN